MTLQQLHDLLALARHGSLHAAARASGQTQPALTRSLGRLEADLGAALFDRHARGVRPTEAGRRLIEHAQRIVAEADRARDAVAQLSGDRRGRVAYGISVAASILLAPMAVQQFRHRYPQVSLHSRSGLYHTLAGPLREGQFDFVICPVPPGAADQQLLPQALLRSEMVIVARRGHPLAGALALEALGDASFVSGGPRGLPGGGIHDAFELAGLGAPRIALHTDGLFDTVALVAGTDCLAMVPAVLARSGLMRESLVALALRDAMPVYEVALFQQRGVPPTPAADELMREFARAAARIPGQASATAPIEGPAKPRGAGQA
ncbi:MAG: LysR family transcriptional regulator, partial [Burkholderiales bacterium]|nr:LysR family transcriptional regulator [Burkholderiales bacterium]